jgi:hypothetical protein
VTAVPWSSVGWWLPPLVYAALLAAPSVTLPGDNLGIRRFITPTLTEHMRLGQTFTMTADGLEAIEVRPVLTDGRPGDVRLELYQRDRNGDATLVRTATKSAAVDGNTVWRFEFMPLLNSRDQEYRFDLIASNDSGVAFRATKGERYFAGSLQANGRDRWADLAFRADAPTPSVWTRLMMLRETNPLRANLVMAAFIGIWLLVGLLVRTLATIPPDAFAHQG